MEQMTNEIKALHADYKGKISVLEANIKKMTLEITHLNEEIESLRAQLDDANKRFTEMRTKLTTELNELRNKYTALETEYHEKMEQNANEIKGLHADYRSKIAVLEANIKKMTLEITRLNEENEGLRAQLDDANKRLNELRNKFNDLSKKSGDDITRLQTEIKNLTDQFNATINGLNAKLNLANSRIDALTKERDDLRNQVTNLHNELEHTKELLNNTDNLLRSMERNYKIMVGDRDREINTLKSTISMMKEDWERLSQAYELLDAEIKKQLCCNDELREVIRNLTCNNKDHNLKINELEAELKIIFEQFVKCALKKKTIDFEDPTKKVDQCEENSLKCKEIIAKMRNNKPAQSSSFSNIEITLETIKGGQTTFTDVKIPSSIKF